jgi:hypothetical protein
MLQDLKKQTALRLAHEQGRGADARPASTPPVVEPPSARINSHPSKTGGGAAFHQNRRGPSLTPDRSYKTSGRGKNLGGDFDGVFRLEEQAIHGTPPTKPLYSPVHVERSLDHALELHRVVPSQTVSTSLSLDSATEKGSNAKLPHGLTVHELKEMTKARLEAEAVQRGDATPIKEANDPILRVAADFRDPMVGSSPSPIPHQSYGRMTTRSPYPIDATGEAWDNASVSTSASDYPGSESMYSTGLNCNASFSGDEAIPFSRSASYPSNPSPHLHDWSTRENTCPPSLIATPPSGYYDTGFAPARRRAATLSPRQGLSYVHEDRPVAPGQVPCFPSDFSSPNHHQRSQRQALSRSRSALVPEVLNFGQARVGYPSAGVIGENNSSFEARPRALSAASLPTISRTSEEFLGENPRGPSTHRFNSTFGSVLEDVASDSVAGLSDVFRGPSPIGRNESANLMGFGSTNSSNGLGSSMDSFGGDVIRMRAASSCDYVGLSDSLGMCSSTHAVDTRHRAATWGEPSALDFFCGHDLSEDLASILKMSGAEQRDTSS